MDYNIVFKIAKDTMSISIINKEVDYKTLNNTNIINTKQLKFSYKYIEENHELVANFLNVIIIKSGITTVKINEMNTATIAMELINYWDHVTKLIFKPNEKVDIKVFMKILDNKYLKYIECFEMPDYQIERLDINKKIKVVTRNKKEYKSRFMKDNFIETFSDIYYKKSCVILCDINDEELNAIEYFIATNNKLKQIRIFKYSNELLASVVDFIHKYKKENIVIVLFEKGNDINTIYKSVNYLKKTYRRYFDDNNIRFKMNYSLEYRRDNFFKELNYKFFTSLIMFGLIIGIVTVGIDSYNQFLDKRKIKDQENLLVDLINRANVEQSLDGNMRDIDILGPGEEETTRRKSNYSSIYYTNFTQVFSKLKEMNNETVGWIQVNGTRINYPVVQSTNNSYYLNRDFNKSKNVMGWIFMDYRNNIDNLDQNTIIYGHNINGGIMFGTLSNILYSSWYKNSTNQTITFNTPNANMRWQVFSVYKIKTTEDYLQTEFVNQEEYMNFINMLKGRSIKNFNVDVPENSKIVTLSTCADSNHRVVLHAVLVKEELTGK